MQSAKKNVFLVQDGRPDQSSQYSETFPSFRYDQYSLLAAALHEERPVSNTTLSTVGIYGIRIDMSNL